jgi:hypothetical protein
MRSQNQTLEVVPLAFADVGSEHSKPDLGSRKGLVATIFESKLFPSDVATCQTVEKPS